MNDKELIQWLEKAILGDESAFQLVYQATHQDVYRTVNLMEHQYQSGFHLFHLRVTNWDTI
ncbi:hypothetical protein [Paenibacillus sp. ACRRY]|uniref:hypothetical protein n=1 Tax=Paenibacillus sp. ACRRY TaxID=2918208 RepID=UPI001EF4B99B|nr:hypothetical protein [Paenibacillus sp. ACRRY]MCG7384511.1 hypothetical protein [Paenibacillus sp. ACRRY]